MMNPAHEKPSLTGMLALLGVAITLACWMVWGTERGVAAGMGAALSVLNWMSLRWLVGRVIAAKAAMRVGFSLLLVAKMGALMAVLFVLMQRFSVEPLGLMLGLGVFFVGPVLGALLLGNGAAGGAPTAGSAGEEH